MPGQVISPPVVLPVQGPLVFLAGPIQGAPDWQREAIACLHRTNADVSIASPRREYLPGQFVFDQQVDWETNYLRRAAEQGVILFWLAREVEHHCDRAYAQTTRFELAEWKVRHERDGVNLVVGIDDGFSGARYVRRRFQLDCPKVPILSTLEDACRAALGLIRPL
jgi:hypothetical protein